MSLTELMVASIVLMIVLTVAANLFINASKSMAWHPPSTPIPPTPPTE